MTVNPRSLANLVPMQPGETRNPGGKPVKSRNRLQRDFIRCLADDFEAHGVDAICKAREQDPVGYIKTIASLMPRELEVSRPLDDFSEEQIDAAIFVVRAILAEQEVTQSGNRTIAPISQKQ